MDILGELSRSNILNHVFFKRVSIDLHFKILTYLDSKDLLEIRATKLGGYQITSNCRLRGKIGNYFSLIQPKLTSKLRANVRKIKLIFEQTGRKALNFSSIQLSNDRIKILVNALKLNTELEEIIFGTIFSNHQIHSQLWNSSN